MTNTTLTTRTDARTFTANNLRGWFADDSWSDELEQAIVGYVWSERRTDAADITLADLMAQPEIAAAERRANRTANGKPRAHSYTLQIEGEGDQDTITARTLAAAKVEAERLIQRGDYDDGNIVRYWLRDEATGERHGSYEITYSRALANRRAAAAQRRRDLAPAMSLRLPADLDAAIRASLAPGQTVAGRIAALIRAGMRAERK